MLFVVSQYQNEIYLLNTVTNTKTVMFFLQCLVISNQLSLLFHQALSLFKISDKASVASVAHAQLAATPAPP